MTVTNQYLKCLQLKLQNQLFQEGFNMMVVELDKVFFQGKDDNKAYETVRLKVYNPNLCTELEGWVSSTTMEEIFDELREGIPRPSTLTASDRLTTKDWMEIVNEPIVEDDAELVSGRR